MSAGQNNFLPGPGRFDVMPVTFTSGPIGGTNYLGGASPLTANQTTIFRLGPVTSPMQFEKFGASVTTVPADADGTIVATLRKYDAVANAAVTLTGTLDLEALTTREGTVVGQLSTVTPTDLTFNVGDTIEVHVVSNSAAIDTQPVGLVFTAEMVVLR